MFAIRWSRSVFEGFESFQSGKRCYIKLESRAVFFSISFPKVICTFFIDTSSGFTSALRQMMVSLLDQLYRGPRNQQLISFPFTFLCISEFLIFGKLVCIQKASFHNMTNWNLRPENVLSCSEFFCLEFDSQSNFIHEFFF